MQNDQLQKWYGSLIYIQFNQKWNTLSTSITTWAFLELPNRPTHTANMQKSLTVLSLSFLPHFCIIFIWWIIFFCIDKYVEFVMNRRMDEWWWKRMNQVSKMVWNIFCQMDTEWDATWRDEILSDSKAETAQTNKHTIRQCNIVQSAHTDNVNHFAWHTS